MKRVSTKPERRYLSVDDPGREFLFRDAISAQSGECIPPHLPRQVRVSTRTRIA